MMTDVTVVDKMVKKVAYSTAEKSTGLICLLFFHQPKVPEAVKKLRKV